MLSPQVKTLPRLLSASLATLAETMALMPESLPVPPGPLTATGVVLSCWLPVPSWPWSLPPQDQTTPAPVSARLPSVPADTAVTDRPSRVIRRGTDEPVLLPSPSSPVALLPQEKAAPVETAGLNGGMRCRERTSSLRSRRQPDQSGRHRCEHRAEFCGCAAPEFPRSRIQLICH